MYEGRLVADTSVAVPADIHAAVAQPRSGHVLLGLAVMLIGLPLLAARVFIWAVARDVGRVATLASIVGEAIADARKR